MVSNTKFDYETKNSYSVRVRATDSGGLSFDKAFTIAVTDVILDGDVNGDDVVDLQDFITLKAHFGMINAALADGDLDGDGDVDLSDFTLLKESFGRKV